MADLSDTERAVLDAFPTGALVDLRGRRDPVVRGTVIRFLLLGGGGTAAAGDLPGLRLTGAHVTGALEVEHADIGVPISLHGCRFDLPVSFFGSRLRRLSLDRSTLPGLIAGNAAFEASLRLTGCRSTGPVGLGNSQISGALLLGGAEVAALDGMALRTSGDVVASDGFTCHGELRLDNAEIGGALRLEGATLDNPGGTALSALDVRVATVANLCDGFRATGAVRLAHATLTSRLCLDGATLGAATGTALDCRHLVTRELVLLPTAPPEAAVDLSHARIGLLRDAPAAWPPALYLDGLTYETLPDPDDRAQRLRWLRLDPRGFRPQTYAHLATVYGGAGRDDDARNVLLEGERHRRATLAWPGRLWGHVQDLTIGYGYRPLRAAAWLAALLALGTVVFGLHPPRPVDPATAPGLVPAVYTLDLIVPGIDLGQQSAYTPRGASTWLAYALIVAGLVLATTIAAAAGRRLRRD